MTIRVLIVDDEPLARGKIRGFLEPHPDFEVAGEAGDGRAALEQLKQLSPDVMFLDVQMPQLDGIQMMGQAGGAKPGRCTGCANRAEIDPCNQAALSGSG